MSNQINRNKFCNSQGVHVTTSMTMHLKATRDNIILKKSQVR